MSMPPQKSHKFFIGNKSLKDVWVNKLRAKEKDIGHQQVKEEFQDLEILDKESLNLRVTRDTHSSRKRFLWVRGKFIS